MTHTFDQLRSMTNEQLARVVAECKEPGVVWRDTRELDGVHTHSLDGWWWKGNGYPQTPEPMSPERAFLLEQEVREKHTDVEILSRRANWFVELNSKTLLTWPRTVSPVRLRYELWVLMMGGVE